MSTRPGKRGTKGQRSQSNAARRQTPPNGKRGGAQSSVTPRIGVRGASASVSLAGVGAGATSAPMPSSRAASTPRETRAASTPSAISPQQPTALEVIGDTPPIEAEPSKNGTDARSAPTANPTNANAANANGTRNGRATANGNDGASASHANGVNGIRPARATASRPRASASTASATLTALTTATTSPSSRATRSIPPDTDEAPYARAGIADAAESDTDEDWASAEPPESPQERQPFWQAGWERVRRLSGESWLWIAVLALAAFLRFYQLGAKPLHHDESMHAYFSLMFARDPSSYAYDPLLHGPFQFHAEGLMFAIIMALEALFHVSRAGNDPWINDYTARIVPALFGLGIVALPYGLRKTLGRVEAWLAALLLAVSPAFVYFSRFLREDIYFNFFMFAMVVCAVQWARKRTITWFALTIAATVLAYATFEGIYLTFAIFGAFLGALLVWEAAASIANLLPGELNLRERLFFTRAGLLVIFAGIGLVIAYIALKVVDSLNTYITANATKSQLQVTQLEDNTVRILLYVSIAIAVWVIVALFWQIFRDSAYAAEEERQYALNAAHAAGDDDSIDLAADELPTTLWEARVDRIVGAPGRWARSLYNRLDPERQSFLRLLLGGSWAQWFVGFVVAWVVFAAMYWEVPFSLVHAFNPNLVTPGDPTVANRTLGSGFNEGIGRGIWQGLYYWIQQQKVARGGQPIYYYFFIIPLYEQIAVVFGLIGIVYALARPTRFRLFLVWWFVASVAIYSWAGEKMPWLTIHMLLPLMLLAGLAIAWAVRQVYAVGRAAWEESAQWGARLRAMARGVSHGRPAVALVSVIIAVLLLIPTVNGMIYLTYRDPAEGPLEPYVYVQTTPDVDLVMNKIDYADQVLHGGKHQLNIVVGAGEEWPFYWYLRNYYLDPHPATYVQFSAQTFTASGTKPDVLLLLPGAEVQSFLQAYPTGYHMKEYRLRAWFDESYKPLPCTPTATKKCPPPGDPLLYGQGLGPYLSYGSNPPASCYNYKTSPAGQCFKPTLAAQRLWSWLWTRQPLGATTGSYDFVFIVRDGLPIQP